ncbi:MAG: transporter substrate-binding domain-containing protein [Methylobacteriaceae bacterium]|jgi:octopine/nopaline transport system substrate-binding protein|nr:transporter substrate-binding domain-containing protein [Methylobacteriaceae bacterium]
MRTLRRVALISAAFATILLTTPLSAQKEILVIATEKEAPPWSSLDASGKPVGFDIDLANALCERMRVNCEIKAKDWSTMFTDLIGEKYDAVMDSVNLSRSRKNILLFSVPYATVPDGFLVRTNSGLLGLPHTGKMFNMDDPDTYSVGIEAFKEFREKLRNKLIGVQIGTRHELLVDHYFRGVASDIKRYPSVDALSQAVLDGEIDVATTDLPELNKALLNPATAGKLSVTGPNFVGGILGGGAGVVFRKDNIKLKEKFDTAIAAMTEDGSLRQLSVKWFKMDVVPPKTDISEE